MEAWNWTAVRPGHDVIDGLLISHTVESVERDATGVSVTYSDGHRYVDGRIEWHPLTHSVRLAAGCAEVQREVRTEQGALVWTNAGMAPFPRMRDAMRALAQHDGDTRHLPWEVAPSTTPTGRWRIRLTSEVESIIPTLRGELATVPGWADAIGHTSSINSGWRLTLHRAARALADAGVIDPHDVLWRRPSARYRQMHLRGRAHPGTSTTPR